MLLSEFARQAAEIAELGPSECGHVMIYADLEGKKRWFKIYTTHGIEIAADSPESVLGLLRARMQPAKGDVELSEVE